MTRMTRSRYQFSLASLFLVTFLVAVAAGALGGMLRAARGEIRAPVAVFVVMAAAAPLAVMVVLSVGRALAAWLRRRKDG
jgi:hypothetical protein